MSWDVSVDDDVSEVSVWTGSSVYGERGGEAGEQGEGDHTDGD